MAAKVSTIGPLNIDLLIVGEGPPDWGAVSTWQGPAEIEMTAAGSVGYIVRDMTRLGLRVRVSSCVADDSFGAFILDTLAGEGVDVSGVRRIANTQTGIGAYLLLFGSRKRPLAYRLPTHSPWPERYSPAEVDALLDADLLLCGGYLHFEQMWHGQVVEIFQEARRRGIKTALDPQFPVIPIETPWIECMADLLPAVDALFLDETEAARSTHAASLDEAACVLLEQGPGVVAIKQGENGSTVYSAAEPIRQPAVHLGRLVDSIGAGDAYDAAFIYAWLQGWPLERCALYASTAAGKTVTAMGGSAAMPTADEVEEILRGM